MKRKIIASAFGIIIMGIGFYLWRRMAYETKVYNQNQRITAKVINVRCDGGPKGRSCIAFEYNHSIKYEYIAYLDCKDYWPGGTITWITDGFDTFLLPKHVPNNPRYGICAIFFLGITIFLLGIFQKSL